MEQPVSWDFPIIAQVVNLIQRIREISEVRSSMAKQFKNLEEFNKKRALSAVIKITQVTIVGGAYLGFYRYS